MWALIVVRTAWGIPVALAWLWSVLFTDHLFLARPLESQANQALFLRVAGPIEAFAAIGSLPGKEF
jgi:hypothetical protein